MSKNVESQNKGRIFAERLAEAMAFRNVNTIDVERNTGITHSAVSHWLSETRTPRIEYLCKLADYLEVSVDYLLGRADI